MSKFDFTANTITCAGRTFPVKYSVTPSGSVMVRCKGRAFRCV